MYNDVKINVAHLVAYVTWHNLVNSSENELTSNSLNMKSLKEFLHNLLQMLNV